MAHSTLTDAKNAKNDEFYTQYSDIQAEVNAYLEYNANTFRDKVVYCNCDDPYESNFFRYFALNFRHIGLKKLIATSYHPSYIANSELPLFRVPNQITANRFIVSEVGDINGDGELTLRDIAEQLKANKNNEWQPLKGNGDFRSEESIQLLQQADIVVTNPPFSLFREYIKQLVDYEKKFLIIGNINAITYKEVFPLLKENKVWLGNNYRINAGAMFFEIPESIANLEQVREVQTNTKGEKIYITRVQGVRWFTNLDHGRRHERLPLMTMADNKKFNSRIQKYEQDIYQKYNNYDAIEVSEVKAVPSDYDGVMGVPVSIMDKYNPEQFEIIGMAEDNGKGFSGGIWDGENPHCVVNGKIKYKRVFIKQRKKTL